MGFLVGFRLAFGCAGLAGAGVGAPSSRRSNSTEAVLGCWRHSSMTPARTGVARRSSTGGGVGPAAANATGEGPAERSCALKIRTR